MQKKGLSSCASLGRSPRCTSLELLCNIGALCPWGACTIAWSQLKPVKVGSCRWGASGSCRSQDHRISPAAPTRGRRRLLSSQYADTCCVLLEQGLGRGPAMVWGPKEGEGPGKAGGQGEGRPGAGWCRRRAGTWRLLLTLAIAMAWRREAGSAAAVRWFERAKRPSAPGESRRKAADGWACTIKRGAKRIGEDRIRLTRVLP
jgi:hypothetical protein